MRILGERILVEVTQEENVSEGGIILSAAKAERKYEGVVIGVGDNKDIAKLGVKIGDYVYYTPGMNTEMPKKENDDKIYDSVSIYDVIAKREEE